MAWKPGDHLTVRGRDWRVVGCTAHADCTSLDLVSVEGAALSRTLLLPFDRPRRAPLPRLAVTSRRDWAERVGARLSRTFPFGGLRFCPRSIQLLAYQLEPALAVFRHTATRVLIGDDVGLGKTVEAGVIVREVVGRRATARVLVIVPAALRMQWKEELASLLDLPSIDANATWLRTTARELPPDVNPWSVPGVYVSSIDFVKRPEVLHPLESVRWDLLVVDEVHGATPGTGRLAALEALGSRASVVALLSATPHSGNQEQFEALCRIGCGTDNAPLVCFRRTRADVDVAVRAVRSRVVTVPPTPHERRLHRLLERYTSLLWASARRGEANPALLATVFRKRALSSAGALAVSLVRRLTSMAAPPAETQPWLPLEGEDIDDAPGDDDADSVLGGKGLDNPASERTILEQCLRAAEAASGSESKTARLLHLLSRLRAPAIVFSEYRDTAMRLRERIAATGRRVVVLHGGLTPDERASVTTEFSRGEAMMVATDAASEGLNLHHACRLVIHYELPWSPGRLHQRCGRVNRIGQRRRVHEIVLVAADTAEQLVLQPLLRRLRESGTFTRGSIVHQLPEALVAARVFDGDQVPARVSAPATPRAQPFITLDLRDEARAEVERLRTMRMVEPPAGGGAGLVIPVTSMPTRRSLGEGATVRRRSASITVVYSVAFRTAAGDMLEEMLVPVAVEDSGRRWRHNPRALRAQLKRALADLSPHLDSAVEAVACARLAAIGEAQRDNASAHEARLRAISRPLPSTAGVLVQPGLFARTAPHPEPMPLPGWLDDAPIGDGDRRIVWNARVEAVICGSLA